jgi:hypothetical protein
MIVSFFEILKQKNLLLEKSSSSRLNLQARRVMEGHYKREKDQKVGGLNNYKINSKVIIALMG